MTEPGREFVESREHTQQVAGEIASLAARNLETQLEQGAGEPQSPPEQRTRPDPTQAPPAREEGSRGLFEGVEGEEGEIEGEASLQEGEEIHEIPPSPELSQLQDLHESLLKQGVNLDMDIENLDPSLYEPATKLMDAAYGGMQKYMTSAQELDQIRLGYEGLMSRLEKQPEQILLAIALDKPQVFEKAASLFSEMAENEAVKQQVIREVETAARQANIDRREALLNEQQVRVLASQIEGEISRQCRLKGVDRDLVTNFVEKEIRLARADGRVFNSNEVGGIVDSLRPKAPAPKPPRHVAPQRQQQVRQAPSAPVSGSAPAPSQSREDVSGTDAHFADHPAHGFRSLVKDAFKKTFSQER